MTSEIIGTTVALFLMASAAQAAPMHGLASWYGDEDHGGLTANGEIFDQYALTCAHRSARFSTVFKVTNLKNGKSVLCRVNDRGPAKWTGRVIDLSRAAAWRIDMVRAGEASVKIETIREPAP